MDADVPSGVAADLPEHESAGLGAVDRRIGYASYRDVCASQYGNENQMGRCTGGD